MGGWQAIDLESIDGEADRPYWIAISLVPGVGGVGFARMLARFGSARAAWAAGDELLDCLPRRPQDAREGLAHIRRRGATTAARQVETAFRASGGVTLTALDPDYPAGAPRHRSAAAGPLLRRRRGRLPGPAVGGGRHARATGYGRSAAARSPTSWPARA